ncbi:MAG TPA: hypothetical protein VMM18_05015 [Gemmatimonadaceae bacterium]|nr:hypothetical protein [Gemmatimonadaceae bacterium]
MRPLRHSRPLRRLPLIALLIVAGPSCDDRNPLAPGLPGRAVLAISPLIDAPPPGGPVITLAKVRATLVRPMGDRADTARADAVFAGDSAVLRFELMVSSPSQILDLEVEAVDAQGTVAFRGGDTIRVAPGRNPALGAPRLRYVAPDTAVRSLILAPADTLVEAGDTVRLSVVGLAADESPVEPVAVGWTSRSPLIAQVSLLGTVKALSLDGEAWIVARTYTGVADSVKVTVRGAVASVQVSPDSAAVLIDGSTAMYAEALDAAGTRLAGHEVMWTSLDPDVAALGPLEQVALSLEPRLSLLAVSETKSVAGTAVIGLAEGVARIVATTSGHADTATVRVQSAAGQIARTEVSPRADTLSAPGESLQLLVASFDVNGALEPGTYTWEPRDPQIASVSSLGTVVALAEGETWILALEARGTMDSALVVVARNESTAALIPLSARSRTHWRSVRLDP